MDQPVFSFYLSHNIGIYYSFTLPLSKSPCSISHWHNCCRVGAGSEWGNESSSGGVGFESALCSLKRHVPPTWTYESDEDLVHYFYDHIGKEDENLGSVKQCVTSIDVSSCSVRNTNRWQSTIPRWDCIHFSDVCLIMIQSIFTIMGVFYASAMQSTTQNKW